MICKASDVSATECVCFKLACLVDRHLLLLGSCVSVSSVRIDIDKADFQSVQSQICQETTWTRFFKNYPAYVCIRVWHKKSQLSKRKFCKKQNITQLKKLHMMVSPFVCTKWFPWALQVVDLGGSRRSDLCARYTGRLPKSHRVNLREEFQDGSTPLKSMEHMDEAWWNLTNVHIKWTDLVNDPPGNVVFHSASKQKSNVHCSQGSSKRKGCTIRQQRRIEGSFL